MNYNIACYEEANNLFYLDEEGHIFINWKY